MRLGILGGTFNPIHLGHLLLAECAREQCALDRVLFVPTAVPPHKPVASLAAGPQRFAMVRLAIRGHPQFRASDLELRRGGVSYTIDTVRPLRDRYPGAKFFLLVGAEMLRVPWRHLEALRRLCTFVVAPRLGDERRRLRRGDIRLMMPSVAISSSMIRDRNRRGQSIRYLVPDPVARYLARHRLYR